MCVCRSFCCRTRLSGVCRRRHEWLVQHRRPATSVTLSWTRRLVGSVFSSGHSIRLTTPWSGVRLPTTAANAGLVTIFGRTNHLGISPSHSGQLSLLLSAGRVWVPAKVQWHSMAGYLKRIWRFLFCAIQMCSLLLLKAGMAHSTCG